MKKKLIYSTAIGVLALAGILAACDSEFKQETIVFDDPAYAPDTTYINPVFEPVLADPTFIRAADKAFYAYGTEDTWPESGGNAGHHIVPILKSEDMINWVYIADAFTAEAKPKWGSTDAGVWAPQITIGSDGKYHLYYSLSTWNDPNPGIGVATSDKPEGPFTDEGKILDQLSSGVRNGIDPFFMTEKIGPRTKNYLFWGSWGGIHVVEMSTYKTANLATKKKIGGDRFEAPYIYKHDGWYYFFGSAGSCCAGENSEYRVTVARSKSITGPYLNHEGQNVANDGVEGKPFLRGDLDYGWVGPGHNAEIIQDDNKRYFVMYHAIDVSQPCLNKRKDDGSCDGATRRPLMLDEITWVDGWPVVNAGTDYEGMPSKSVKQSPYFNEAK